MMISLACRRPAGADCSSCSTARFQTSSQAIRAGLANKKSRPARVEKPAGRNPMYLEEGLARNKPALFAGGNYARPCQRASGIVIQRADEWRRGSAWEFCAAAGEAKAPRSWPRRTENLARAKAVRSQKRSRKQRALRFSLGETLAPDGRAEKLKATTLNRLDFQRPP